MELFQKAKTIRLRSYRDKYLTALDDGETVIQDRDGSAKNATWTVEFVPGTNNALRLVSCYGTYLTASNIPFVPKTITGRRVLQTVPESDRDPRIDWEPIRDGFQVKLHTAIWGNFLRPNGGVPPWRNSITHDIPHRTSTHNKMLWDVEVVEIRNVPKQPPNNKEDHHRRAHSDFTFNRSRSCSSSKSFLSRNSNVLRPHDFV
ncbi:OLC1v1023575C1 [Oldenlandia corymbosa var. corymbosa]|uniref:OLC1v1023575C1 n=1 Tax=Oldenlandia corymbosa var. corymbosa TaxID=529605 RepID=A0AAV1C096_OLDCO|nr:OLC1v1023575C1 [Oldenlandia corymbosa var. corymbosa]